MRDRPLDPADFWDETLDPRQANCEQGREALGTAREIVSLLGIDQPRRSVRRAIWETWRAHPWLMCFTGFALGTWSDEILEWLGFI